MPKKFLFKTIDDHGALAISWINLIKNIKIYKVVQMPRRSAEKQCKTVVKSTTYIFGVLKHCHTIFFQISNGQIHARIQNIFSGGGGGGPRVE